MSQPIRIDVNGAVPLAQGTLVDVWGGVQDGFLSDASGVWLQVVETGVIYADALFYRKASGTVDRSAPQGLELRADLKTSFKLRGRVSYCRVCFTWEMQVTTLVVQPETTAAAYR